MISHQNLQALLNLNKKINSHGTTHGTTLKSTFFICMYFVPTCSGSQIYKKWYKDWFSWCPHTDSNREPTDYKSVALPIELWGRKKFFSWKYQIKQANTIRINIFFQKHNLCLQKQLQLTLKKYPDKNIS